MDNPNQPAGEDGDPQGGLTAAQWSALRQRLTSQAERALWWMRKGTVSADDTAMSTLRTYLRQSRDGELPPPTDPDSIWPILQQQLDRKVDKAAATQRYKKNKMAVRYSEMATLVDGRAAETAFVDGPFSPDDVEAYVAEALQLLTDSIDEEDLLKIARLKLECHCTEEIAELTSLSEHQVRRRLSRIRALLSEARQADA